MRQTSNRGKSRDRMHRLAFYHGGRLGESILRGMGSYRPLGDSGCEVSPDKLEEILFALTDPDAVNLHAAARAPFPQCPCCKSPFAYEHLPHRHTWRTL